MRILIAEDDEALGGFVRRGLEAEHYVVDVSCNGEQVRSLAQDVPYDLLLLDLSLPQLDGVAVLRQVRVRKPSLPVLVLSARSRVEERVQCLDFGAMISWQSPLRSRSCRPESGRFCGDATQRMRPFYRWVT